MISRTAGSSGRHRGRSRSPHRNMLGRRADGLDDDTERRADAEQERAAHGRGATSARLWV